MTNRVRRAQKSFTHPRRLGPIERALMLIALDLDPRYLYTDHELQIAWRRRRAQVRPQTSGDTMLSAINAAYVKLIGQAPTPRPTNVRL